MIGMKHPCSDTKQKTGNMKYDKIAGFIAGLAAITAVAGCTPEEIADLAGSDVVFGASTMWQSGPETRTEYSGKDKNDADINVNTNVTSNYERIDWVRTTDRIRIYSPEAAKLDGTTHYADYYISSDPDHSTDPQKSQAEIACTEQNGLQWNGAGTHNFYALYPAPGTAWKYRESVTVADAEASIGVNNSQVQITGTIPATQKVIWNNTQQEYEANMNYAYMYASTASTRSSNVALSFHPLVTTLEFNIKAGSENTVGYTLTGFKLKSSHATLAGNFKVTLPAPPTQVDPANDISIVSGTGTDEINLDILYDSGVTAPTLTTSSTIKLTVLTLPVSQTDLSIEMQFQKGTTTLTRSLALKAGSPLQSITVPACKKSYIFSLGVPGGFVYDLEVGCETRSLPQGGGTLTYKVLSSKKPDTNPAVETGWTAQFSTDGKTWTTTVPSWLTSSFTAADGGSTTPEAFSVTIGANNSGAWRGSTTSVATSSANARDLSCYDIYGNKIGGTEGSAPYNTANCYVVSAPGWYKIPCVYGNGYRNGSVNGGAFQGPSSGSGVMTGQFQKHSGTIAANKPWIKDNSVSIAKVALLWQDVSKLISQVSYSNNYIYFYVDPSYIAQGNALIAAQLSNSTVVWSWHIWVMDNPASNLETKEVYSHPSYPAANNPNGMLSRNMGYSEYGATSRGTLVKITQTASGLSQTFNVTQDGTFYRKMVHYQWGRKDPMWPIRINSGSSNTPDPFATGQAEATWYNISGGSISRPGNSGTASIAQSITNPASFITGGSNYCWSGTRYDNLWNTNITSAQSSAVQRAVKKTIYDPCPPGYKVPDKNAFTGFSRTGTSCQRSSNDFSAWNKNNVATYEGYYFYLNKDNHSAGTIFFPFTGSRFPSNGKHFGMRVTNGWGDYPTAASMMRSSDVALSYFTIHEGDMDPFAVQVRAFGYPMRCIADR